jgi:hypothetical protein
MPMLVDSSRSSVPASASSEQRASGATDENSRNITPMRRVKRNQRARRLSVRMTSTTSTPIGIAPVDGSLDPSLLTSPVP